MCAFRTNTHTHTHYYLMHINLLSDFCYVSGVSNALVVRSLSYITCNLFMKLLSCSVRWWVYFFILSDAEAWLWLNVTAILVGGRGLSGFSGLSFSHMYIFLCVMRCCVENHSTGTHGILTALRHSLHITQQSFLLADAPKKYVYE